MQALPPKCRASLDNLGCAVAGKITRSKGTNTAKTYLTRQEHFLAFCCCSHINNPCVELPTPVSQNYFLACYAVLLIQGITISGTTICSNIIKNYVNAAYNLFTDKAMPSPCSSKTDFIDVIEQMLKNYKKSPINIT